MEKDLEHVANEILNGPGVYGCLISDQRGLCLTGSLRTCNYSKETVNVLTRFLYWQCSLVAQYIFEDEIFEAIRECQIQNHNLVQIKYPLILLAGSVKIIEQAKGKASTESAGIVEAIANLAGELEPKSKPPVIVFENDQRSCTIQHHGTITAAIYRTLD